MSENNSWEKWQVAFSGSDVPWKRPPEAALKWGRGWNQSGIPVDWQPNTPFKAALKFVEMFHEGRSSTHAIFVNLETKGKYVMRNQDLEYVLLNGAIVQGLVLGVWRFRRDSGRCSVVPVELISTYDFEEK